MWSIQSDWCIPVDANGIANTNGIRSANLPTPPSSFTSSFLRLSPDGMRTMECTWCYAHNRMHTTECVQRNTHNSRTMNSVQWNLHGIYTMGSAQWNPHHGICKITIRICTIDCLWWNAFDGMRSIECARWKRWNVPKETAQWNPARSNLRDGIRTMEFVRWLCIIKSAAR